MDSDSDSSVAGLSKTSVLLGYASENATSDTVSHIGGSPVWLASQSPSSSLTKCKVCNDQLALLLQLNGNLDEFPHHERMLYVFSCRRPTCRRKPGSVRAIRGVKTVEIAQPQKPEEQEPKPRVALGSALFGNNVVGGAKNPFSTSSSSAANPFSPSGSTSANPFSSGPSQTSGSALTSSTTPASLAPKLASSLFISPPPPPTGPEPPSVPAKPYPSLYLDAEYEFLEESEKALPMPETFLKDEEPSSSKEDKTLFESSHDKTFQTFADRLSQNPDQVLRYAFRGEPLLYSSTDAVGKALSSGMKMPRCSNCNVDRVFEVQLTPQLIVELENDEEGFDGMEWGTVIVGVCGVDCDRGTSEDYLEEWVGIQWEEIRR